MFLAAEKAANSEERKKDRARRNIAEPGEQVVGLGTISGLGPPSKQRDRAASFLDSNLEACPEWH